MGVATEVSSVKNWGGEIWASNLFVAPFSVIAKWRACSLQAANNLTESPQ